MRLLALDLSLSATGVVDPDGQADTIKAPKGLIEGARLQWWHQTFRVLFDQHQPTRIAIEAPYVGRMNNTIKLGELYGVFRLALAEHGRPVIVTWVPPSSLKKVWTGKGNATKTDMYRACLDVWYVDPGLYDDNAIDALALWHTTFEGHWDNPAGTAA